VRATAKAAIISDFPAQYRVAMECGIFRFLREKVNFRSGLGLPWYIVSPLWS